MKDDEIEVLVGKCLRDIIRFSSIKKDCIAYCIGLNAKQGDEKLKEYTIQTAALCGFTNPKQHKEHYQGRLNSLKDLKAQNKMPEDKGKENEFFMKNYDSLVKFIG